jgi:uncharacterized protein (DUF1778 family)
MEPKKERKDNAIHIRISSSLKDIYKEAAKKAGAVDLTDWIIKLCNKELK